MTPLSNSLPPLWGNLGFLVGFLLSLAILSFAIRDSWLVRAAQYLLVGVTLAYTVVLIWINVLWPRLFAPLLSTSSPSGATLWNSWLPLAAGLILWAAGIDHLRSENGRSRNPWLRWAAAGPLALLVGVGLGAGIAGALQGTLLPQFRHAALSARFIDQPPPLLLAGLLIFAITGGALLHLQLGAASGDDSRYPVLLRPALAAWAWLGERALWLAAGVIFARLFASRMTLLIARLDALFFDEQVGAFWRWLLGGWPGG